MRTVSLLRASALLLATGVAGCGVSDADLAGPSVTKFTLEPSAATTPVYEIQMAGGATLAYDSDLSATLEIAVEGQAVFAKSYEVPEMLEFPIDVALPLLRHGRNDIVATLEYNGGTFTVESAVSVEEPSATVVLPTWTRAKDQTQVVTVTPAAGWTAAGLEYSINGGSFMDAAPADGGGFSVALEDLDIGDNELVLLAHSDNAGHDHVVTLMCS